MTRSVPLALLTLAACQGDGSGKVTDTGAATTPTPPTTTPVATAASCALTPQNTLRVTCTATLAAPGTTTLTLSADGVPTRTFQADAPGTEVELFGWGLKPDTAYTWRIGDEASGLTGTVTTGAPPADLLLADIAVSGTPQGFDAVLEPLRCNNTQYFAMIDGDGDIVWYQQNALYSSGMTGYDWSQADRSLLVLSGTTFNEVHVSGPTLLALAQNTDFTGTLHHDTARWGAYTYLLHEYDHNGADVDGVHVFEGNALRGTFHLEDHFTVTPGAGGPGPADDWSHANAVKVDEDGTLVMSIYKFDTVLGIDGDPTSPTFLDILWQVDGSGNGLPGADYTAPAGADEGFARQHNTSRNADGLWVFDNAGTGNGSRAARYALDDASGEVRHVEHWDLGADCPIQGGAVPVGDGVLATCTSNRAVRQFVAGQASPVFSLDAACGVSTGGPGGDSINRGLPVVIE